MGINPDLGDPDSRTYEDDVRAQVSQLWAEDWDSDEDAVYDEWGEQRAYKDSADNGKSPRLPATVLWGLT